MREADNCRRTDNYRGAEQLHLGVGATGITIGGGEGVTGVMVLQLKGIRRNMHGLGKRFVYLGN